MKEFFYSFLITALGTILGISILVFGGIAFALTVSPVVGVPLRVLGFGTLLIGGTLLGRFCIINYLYCLAKEEIMEASEKNNDDPATARIKLFEDMPDGSISILTPGAFVYEYALMNKKKAKVAQIAKKYNIDEELIYISDLKINGPVNKDFTEDLETALGVIPGQLTVIMDMHSDILINPSEHNVSKAITYLDLKNMSKKELKEDYEKRIIEE